MPHRKDRTSDDAAGVVNWNPPEKRELVQRALSDGMADPHKIVEWAKNYNVSMSVEDVSRIAAELKAPDAGHPVAKESGS